MLEMNPWIGLKGYNEGQKLLGRKDKIDQLLNFLLRKHFVVLCGNSGVGKTSLIRAGLFPVVRKNKILPIYIRLSYMDNHSGLEQIVQSIYFEIDKSQGQFQINEIFSINDGEIDSLQHFFQRKKIVDVNGQEITPLIVLDQFEEVLTLNRGDRTFYVELFKQLDAVISYKYIERTVNPPFYLIISIRESFLSFIDRNTENKELRLNRLFLEDMNEEEAYEVIGGNNNVIVDKETSELIISKICGRTDFSINGIPEIQVPTIVLSQYMAMLYNKCINSNQNEITKDLVNLYSPENCFEQLYLEAIERLPESKIDYIEDVLLTSDGRRDNVSIEDIFRHGISENELRHLITSNILREFIYADSIRVELANDFLCPILKERIKERELSRQLEKEAQKLDKEVQIISTNRNIGVIQHLMKFLQTTIDSNAVLINEYEPQKVDFDIFISYRRIDGRDVARNIQQALKAHGYKRIFFDYDSIQKGEFTNRIVDAISSCTDFILVLSPKSMKRCSKKGDPVANEIRTAVKYNKNIIPVTIDGKEVKWPRSLPDDLKFIKRLQFHDHRSDSYFEHSINELCEKLTCKKS